MASIPHVFHSDIETLIEKMQGAMHNIAAAPPPHQQDRPVYGDERAHEIRVFDFEKQRSQALAAIASAMQVLAAAGHRTRTVVDAQRNLMQPAEVQHHERHERMLAEAHSAAVIS